MGLAVAVFWSLGGITTGRALTDGVEFCVSGRFLGGRFCVDLSDLDAGSVGGRVLDRAGQSFDLEACSPPQLMQWRGASMG